MRNTEELVEEIRDRIMDELPIAKQDADYYGLYSEKWVSLGLQKAIQEAIKARDAEWEAEYGTIITETTDSITKEALEAERKINLKQLQDVHDKAFEKGILEERKNPYHTFRAFCYQSFNEGIEARNEEIRKAIDDIDNEVSVQWSRNEVKKWLKQKLNIEAK